MMQSMNKRSKLTPFSADIDHLELPTRFTFPYYYSPHPLALAAIEELQQYLETQNDWQHDFSCEGKMFAVLVVQTEQGELGYLSSFAGYLSNAKTAASTPDSFVNNICHHTNLNSEISLKEAEIKDKKFHIKTLENKKEFKTLKLSLLTSNKQADVEISRFQAQITQNKENRKQLRNQAESKLASNLISEIERQELNQRIKDLGNQSSHEKRAFKSLKQKWKQTVIDISNQVDTHLAVISAQKVACDLLSKSLETHKQKSCRFLNQLGQSKSLHDLFNSQDSDKAQIPIAQSSEENLTKLLQSAFQFGYTPLALGEFWWGASPYDQIRQHKNLYPVCQSKCFEIIEYMLQGIDTDKSPLEQTPSLDKELEFVYEDDALVVVNKPAEFLSVSGKYISDSVLARIQKRYPNATGPLLVHRLDMSTSGLLVFTLTAETNKHVQRQFIERTVEKRYTALLEGNVEHEMGVIKLPLQGDMEDRPRQMVHHKNGRSAETRYQVISTENSRTRVHLYPKTGRTHQLRVHCAHQAGLNTPIVGDDLYGFKDDRLHLHAGYLKLLHPVTNQEIEFEVPAEF
ncbi:pseudouridine synthase [Vibrio kyushuensis]|uniref:RluA family pseudouridine synthase n=1 Tax=Vibrio kyushuensis TaxID=2910249 RepID=UPI003D144E99